MGWDFGNWHPLGTISTPHHLSNCTGIFFGASQKGDNRRFQNGFCQICDFLVLEYLQATPDSDSPFALPRILLGAPRNLTAPSSERLRRLLTAERMGNPGGLAQATSVLHGMIYL